MNLNYVFIFILGAILQLCGHDIIMLNITVTMTIFLYTYNSSLNGTLYKEVRFFFTFIMFYSIVLKYRISIILADIVTNLAKFCF